MTRAHARRCTLAIGLIWLVQLVALGYFFTTAAWTTYWFCREVYGPGVALFRLLARPLLPARLFSPLDPVAIFLAFASAALIYATLMVLAARSLRPALRRAS